MLPLAHHTKAENKHNTTNHWLKTLFFIFVVSLAVIATPAVSEKGKTLSMTSEVMGGQRGSQIGSIIKCKPFKIPLGGLFR
jgi:hypothetical protein